MLPRLRCSLVRCAPLALALATAGFAAPPPDELRDAWRDLQVGQFAVYETSMQGMPNPMSMRYEVTAVEANAVVYSLSTDMHMQGVPPQTQANQRHEFVNATAQPGQPQEQPQMTEGSETVNAGGRDWSCHWMEITSSGQTTKIWYAQGAPVFMGAHPQHGGVVKVQAATTTTTLSDWGPR